MADLAMPGPHGLQGIVPWSTRISAAIRWPVKNADRRQSWDRVAMADPTLLSAMQLPNPVSMPWIAGKPPDGTP